MKASLTYHGEHDPEYDYRTVQYIVSIDGRGIYSAMSRREADDLIERVNNYPETLAALKDAKRTIARLQKRVKRLTANFDTKALRNDGKGSMTIRQSFAPDAPSAGTI